MNELNSHFGFGGKKLTNKEEIGKRIRYARSHVWGDRGMTQVELAKQLDCSRDTVRNWESGRVMPDVEKLKRVAAVCQTDWRWLLFGDVVNGYTDDRLKDILVDSFRILSSFNPYAEDERFKEALFRVIGHWGIGVYANVDEITDKQGFYDFMKSAIISNIKLYMEKVEPLVRKEDQNEQKHDEDG